jgi:hypothetical protein
VQGNTFYVHEIVIYWVIISCNGLVSGNIFPTLKIKWVPPKRSTRLSGQTTAVQRKRIFLVLRKKKILCLIRLEIKL